MLSFLWMSFTRLMLVATASEKRVQVAFSVEESRSTSESLKLEDVCGDTNHRQGLKSTFVPGWLESAHYPFCIIFAIILQSVCC